MQSQKHILNRIENRQMKNYTKEFDDWFASEKKNGLVDVKFFTGELKDSTVESFAQEAISILHCKKSSDLPNGF